MKDQKGQQQEETLEEILSAAETLTLLYSKEDIIPPEYRKEIHRVRYALHELLIPWDTTVPRGIREDIEYCEYHVQGVLPDSALKRIRKMPEESREKLKNKLESLVAYAEDNLFEILVAIKTKDQGAMQEFIDELKIPAYDPMLVAEDFPETEEGKASKLTPLEWIREAFTCRMALEVKAQAKEGGAFFPRDQLKLEPRGELEKAAIPSILAINKLYLGSTGSFAVALAFCVLLAPMGTQAIVAILMALTAILGGAAMASNELHGDDRYQLMKAARGFKHIKEGDMPEEVLDRFPGLELNSQIIEFNRVLGSIDQIPRVEMIEEIMRRRAALMGYVKEAKMTAFERVETKEEEKEAKKQAEIKAAEDVARELEEALRPGSEASLRRALDGVTNIASQLAELGEDGSRPAAKSKGQGSPPSSTAKKHKGKESA